MNYFRIILGQNSKYFHDYHDHNIIGVGFLENHDFSSEAKSDWKEFRLTTKELFAKNLSNPAPVSIGLAQGTVWGIIKEMNIGDIVIVPDGNRMYYAAEIASDYVYDPSKPLPHIRKVKWLGSFSRDEMTDEFKLSTRTLNTLTRIGGDYVEELTNILAGNNIIKAAPKPQTECEASRFGLETHLEDFMVANWNNLEISKKFDIYNDENGTGQQYPVDTGRIDILAISKDKKTWLVIELKRDQANDDTVGQVLRYMGFVKSELARGDEDVRGLIVARTNDCRGLHRALQMLDGKIDFYTYEIKFDLKQQSFEL